MASVGRRLLHPEEIETLLKELPGWTLEERALRKRFALSSFASAVDLVNAVARVAEQLNHHPDMFIQYRQVTFILSTHDLGGVSTKDVELAHRIEESAAAVTARGTAAGGGNVPGTATA